MMNIEHASRINSDPINSFNNRRPVGQCPMGLHLRKLLEIHIHEKVFMVDDDVLLRKDEEAQSTEYDGNLEMFRNYVGDHIFF